ncbi:MULTISPECIES: heavy-metal-associated domain-containing protein [unclassified Prevotella]|uniref:heavy-metal-associated domain-containing protein n=1 Tax=unclassified Prevotella TaxID=2638335 RepID=UPI000491B399|nr:MULTISPECIES: heavy-metal-associated domain-containing protein [unclassified Prevotella]
MRTKALFIAMAFASICLAKDIKTVVLTTNPQMHCISCEKKIKDNIRFEKGIKSIKTDLDNKTVTIEYDADKTSVADIIEGFKKIKYDATEVKSAPKKVDAETGATPRK